MSILTEAQSDLINTVEIYAIDYEAEALASYESTGDDLADELEQRADRVIEEACAYTAREDLGGLTVYFKGTELVAFYDYEQFKGTIF